jgi:AraC-like DNA-binding protein
VAEPTVAAGIARGLLGFAAGEGADRAALLERSGMGEAELADPDARVALASYLALIRAAKALTGDSALALHFGEAVDIRDLSIVGLLGEAGATAMEAYDQVNRFAPLAIDSGTEPRFAMVRRDGELWMVDKRPDSNSSPEITESAMARIVASGRRLGFTAPLLEIHFTHEEPPYRAEYDRIFDVPITFGADWNAVRIDEKMMSIPVGMQNPYVVGILREHAEALLEQLESARTVAGRVEALLAPMLAGGEAGIAAVASGMGISRQTLYRRLKAEGLTFEAVLDGLRHKLALQYLGSDRVSVEQAAWMLGFSDRAGFSRAFKRWTGTSPGAMRG